MEHSDVPAETSQIFEEYVISQIRSAVYLVDVLQNSEKKKERKGAEERLNDVVMPNLMRIEIQNWDIIGQGIDNYGVFLNVFGAMIIDREYEKATRFAKSYVEEIKSETFEIPPLGRDTKRYLGEDCLSY